MPSQGLSLKFNESNRGRPLLVPADKIDFAVDTNCGGLVMFLPLTDHAETWIETGGLSPAVRWLGVFLLEDHTADTTIRRMLAGGMRLRIDGRVVDELSI